MSFWNDERSSDSLEVLITLLSIVGVALLVWAVFYGVHYFVSRIAQ